MHTPYIRELTIRFSETDNRGQLKIVSLFDYFQDVGSDHAALLGISAHDLLRKNYTWVMLKYSVRIERLPRWKEQVVMKTWRCPLRNLYELRQFDIEDPDGKLLIRSLSAWVMMNVDSRKPTRLDRFIPSDLMDIPASVTDDFLRLAPFDAPDDERMFNVRMQDIDFNNHVNNSVYIGWAVETVPQAIFNNHTLRQVEVNYINEISYGNRIFAQIRQEPGDSCVFVHQILGGEDRRELTRLRTVWE